MSTSEILFVIEDDASDTASRHRSLIRYATRAINAVVVLQLRNYVDDSQHGTFRALGVVRMGKEGTEEEGRKKRSATSSRRWVSGQSFQCRVSCKEF